MSTVAWLSFAKMISQARTLRISDIQIGVPSEESLRKTSHVTLLHGLCKDQTGFSV